MYKTVVFDIDGTILNGTEGILCSIKKTIRHFNLEMPSDNVLIKFVGPPLQDSCKNLLALDDNISQKFSNYFREELIKEDIFKAEIYKEIPLLLEKLRNQKIKLGVATYKREDLVVKLLKYFGIDQYFDSICGADNENKLKKIDILKKCMIELDAKKESTILIGDSVHDAEAAGKLDIGFIGVTYGFGFKSIKEIKKYNPLLCADNVNEIINYFKGNINAENDTKI